MLRRRTNEGFGIAGDEIDVGRHDAVPEHGPAHRQHLSLQRRDRQSTGKPANGPRPSPSRKNDRSSLELCAGLGTDCRVRGRAVDAHNFRPILDFFWCAYCWTGQQNDPVVQETLVLASLLPHARSIGARRVLRDAVLRGKDADANEHLADLEAMLQQGRTTEIDTRTFHEQIADALEAYGHRRDDMIVKWVEFAYGPLGLGAVFPPDAPAEVTARARAATDVEDARRQIAV